MALDRIRLADFRNHRSTRLDGARRFNLLLGPNGAGKTNVLEALSLFAPGRGLRRAALSAMVREGGQGGFVVGADLVSGLTPVRLGTGIEADNPGRRVVKASGAALPVARLAEWLSVSWLTPAMDGLFTDSASARRRFLDRLVIALVPAHAAEIARYEKALRERNRILAGPGRADPQWLDALEHEMADAGTAVVGARAGLVARLGEAIAALPDGPFARPALGIASHPPDALAHAWREGRRADRAAGRTLVGPHRDDLSVSLVTAGGETRAADTCSTGEQKALLVAIVLAHAELAAGSRPLILLLDEIAAHLDAARRAALFARLAASGAQVWMTGTDAEPFAALGSDAQVWRLAGGALAEA